MHVAVIGGLGYIGRHVVQQLLTLGYKVLVIDKNDDRLVIGDLKKFDRTGKQFSFIKLSLPATNTRFKDLIISNNITSVINVAGLQDTSAQTLYLAKYIYCYLSTSCKKVKTYVHATPMDDRIGYGYDKRLKLDVYPENWLSYHTVKDNQYALKVGVLRLPIAYGHDTRINLHGTHHLWAQLESVRNGLLDKIPTFTESVETEDGTAMRDYCSVFDVAGGVIDMMGYLQNSKGFDFAACDIGSGIELSTKQFIDIYSKQNNVKIVTDPIIKGRPRANLGSDPISGGAMIGWTKVMGDTILDNSTLNNIWLDFEQRLLNQQV